MRERIVIALAALAIGLAGAGCKDKAALAQSKRTEKLTSDTSRLVEVQSITSQPIADELEITGQIATSDDTQVSAKQAGRLMAVYVKDGDPVTAGQVIAEVETTTLNDQLSQAVAQAANTSAQLASSRATLVQQIRTATITPQKSASGLGQAQAALRSARAGLQKALNGARPQERAQAQASLAQAQTNLDVQNKEFQRVQTLVKEGAIAGNRLEQQQNLVAQAQASFKNSQEALGLLTAGTRTEDISVAREAVRQAEETVRTAKATQDLDASLQDQVNAARAQVAALQASLQSSQAAIRIAQQNLTDAKIRAPFTGRIDGAPAQVGQVVAPGTLVARLVGEGASYFQGDVPEDRLTTVKVGQQVQVKISAIDKTVSGHIAAIAPSTSAVGRQFTARIELNERPPGLSAGLFATGVITLRTLPDAVVLPNDVVVKEGDKNYVETVDGDVAKRIPVTLGIQKGDQTQVIGVPVGAKVIVRGQASLPDGTKLTIAPPAKTGDAATTTTTGAPSGAGGS